MRTHATAIMISLLLGGCASTMSGLDGESKFSCKAPDGVTCSSLSGVYANAVAGNLPALRKPESESSDKTTTRRSEIAGRAPESGSPIRTQPKVLRVWIAPWEDSEGDLHDQSFIYVVADPGRWMIEHNQKRIVDRYRPTFIQSGATQQRQQPGQQQSSQTNIAFPDGVTQQGAKVIYGGGQNDASSKE